MTSQNPVTTIEILGTEIPIIEYQGQRVVTFAIIDKVHKRPEGTAGRNFRYNRKYLKINEDYFEVGRDEIRRDLWESFGFSKFAAKGILLTESGYLMLVKSLTDDLAWEVQRALVNHYFRNKSTVENPKQASSAATFPLSVANKQRVMLIEVKRKLCLALDKATSDTYATLRASLNEICALLGEKLE